MHSFTRKELVRPGNHFLEINIGLGDDDASARAPSTTSYQYDLVLVRSRTFPISRTSYEGLRVGKISWKDP